MTVVIGNKNDIIIIINYYYKSVTILVSMDTCAGGELYSWGRGSRGRLGRETEEDSFEPRPVPFEHSQSVHDVDCSQGVCVLLTRPVH